MFDTCLILAGGRGQRLRPLTDTVPKPLIKVNGRSIIEYQIDQLTRQGIQNFLVLTGYKANAFEELEEKYKAISHIHVSTFETPANYLTLRRIFLSRHLLYGDILILYGDNYAEVDAAEIYKKFKYRGEWYDAISVLAAKRKNSESKQREFIDHIESYNPYASVRPTSVDIGFFCLEASFLRKLLDHESIDLDQKFEDWYFSNPSIRRSYHPYFWSYLSITDKKSLMEAEAFFNSRITLFTDRDGVLVNSVSRSKYITEISDLAFNFSLLANIGLSNKKIERIIIVTNQAWASGSSLIYSRIARYVERVVKEQTGVTNVETLTCMHAIEERCDCRKPKPMLMLEYLNNLPIPLMPSHAHMFGDSSSDLGFAKHLMLGYTNVLDADTAKVRTWFQD